MNNRGQVLTIFVLLLPIISLLFVLAVDISNLVINKLEIDNINHILVDYALDEIEESNLEDLINNLAYLNDPLIETNIELNNQEINIILTKELKGIITKQKIYHLKSDFLGYFDNDKKIIKRIKGDNNES